MGNRKNNRKSGSFAMANEAGETHSESVAFGAAPSGGSFSANAAHSTQFPASRITFLKLKTRSIFDRLESIRTDMDCEKLCQMDEYDLQGLLQSLTVLESNFAVAHNSLEEMDFESMSSEVPAKFDSSILSLRTILQRELGSRSSTKHCSTINPNSSASQSIVVMANRSRLPQLELPRFSGIYTEWANFFSMFTAIIDKESELTPIEKLQHLRSCLSGAALNTISSLEINEANYIVALDILKRRFDNKRFILQAHIRGIFGLEKADASVGKLRELTDRVTSHIRAMESLASKEEVADCILVQTVLQKLDKATQSRWEETSSNQELPSWEKLSGFLEKRCRTLENADQSTQGQDQVGKSGKTVSTHHRKSFVASSAPVSCVLCEGTNHMIANCPRFAPLSPNDRQVEAKRLLLCLNCLRKGHHVKDCKSGPCRTCRSKHHTLLHFVRPTETSQSASTSKASQQQPSHSAMVAMSSSLPQALISQSHSDAVLLATVVVLVKNNVGTFVPCRALLDSGSQLHFVTSRLANQLKLRKTKSLTAVSGIGDASFSTEGISVDLVLKSRISEFTTSITSVVAQKITDKQPSIPISVSNWNIPSNIQLADPSFHKPQRIDLLIGAGLFFELLCVGQIQLAPGLPLLQKTHFGWIISGGGHSGPNLSSFVAAHSSDCGHSGGQSSPNTSSLTTAQSSDCGHSGGQSSPYLSSFIAAQSLAAWHSGVHLAHNTSSFSTTQSSDETNHSTRLDELIHQFWEVENTCGPIAQAAKEEHHCEEHSVTNTRLVAGTRPPLFRRLSSERVNISLSLKHINSFGVIMRPVGYVQKFKSGTKSPHLSSKNLCKGSKLLRRILQLAHLHHKFGPIRVGGRLHHSTLGFDDRHPIILPRDHPRIMTFAIITHFYRKHHHAGPQALGAMPIGGIKTVSRALRKIFICCKSRTRLVEHIIADLRKDRVQDSPAFDFTGIDYGSALYNDSYWRFIPFLYPHFVGLLASVKKKGLHMYRSVGSSLFTFDELRTLVCQIQAVINSRPLIAISENPEYLRVLTPGHFLIGRPLMEFPEPDVTGLNYKRLDGGQRITCAQQIFWKRWSEEYLTLLQQRAKWRTPQPSIQVNDVVCIKDENLPPLKWPLARVIEVIAGADGTVRVAVLRTPSGTTRRAVNKLCVLPVEDPVKSPGLSTGGSMFGAAAAT